MATKGKTPKVGDPVLWLGYALEITALETKDVGHGTALEFERNKQSVTVAAMENVAAAADSEAARKEIKEIREAQAAGLKGDAHDAAHERITALSEVAKGVIIRIKLRVDLLDWWEERGVWVSDGRILSDAQDEAWRALTGSKASPAAGAQRPALAYLESQGRA